MLLGIQKKRGKVGKRPKWMFEWIKKLWYIYIHNGKLLSHKKECF